MNKTTPLIILLIIGIALSAISISAFPIIYTANGTYTPPTGTTQILVEVWGAGGGGGSGGGSSSGASGGGGGYARSLLNVTPGTTYTVTIGTGGTGGIGTSIAGTAGSPSWFNSTTTVYADSGKGGAGGSGTGSNSGAGGSNNTGQVKFNGGTAVGGATSAPNAGSGGGGAGGDQTVGGAGARQTGGAGGANRGGNGGAGGAASGNASAGSNYGGGGGGGGSVSGAGGNGGNGTIIIYPINTSYTDYYVTVQDEQTVANINTSLYPINYTVSVTTNTSGDISYTGQLGTKLFIPAVLNSEVLNLKISATNYTQRSYILTGAGNTTSNFTAFIAQGLGTALLTITDQITSQAIVGATAYMFRDLGNGSLSMIESSYSDVTGVSDFQYLANVRYVFLITQPSYNAKSFVLDPITYSAYTIKLLSGTATANFSPDYQNVLVTYDPKVFYANQTNTFTISFSSITNSFTNVTYNLTYPGGSKSGSSTNPSGATFINTFNITGGNVFSNANLTISYSTAQGTKNFSFTHGIIYGPNNGTFIANAGNTYGMGLLERTIVGTIIIIIFAGAISLAAGPLAGLTIALFIMGLFIKIGFWEWWLAGISFLIGFIMIIRRSG